MLPPNVGQQRVGVNPIETQQQSNTNQKLAEILESFQSRLDNVLNVRTEVQSATFNAFGNNFLTRGMTQLSDSIADSIKTLFAKPEAEREDPVLAQLKLQTSAIERLADSNSVGSNAVVNALEDGFTSLRIDQKQHRIASKDEAEHQVSLLTDILHALEETTQMPQSPSQSDRGTKRVYDDIIDVEDVQSTPTPSSVPRIGTDLQNATDVDPKTVRSKDQEFKKDQTEKSSKTLKTLAEINDKLSQIVGTIDISTQERDAEAARAIRDKNVVSDVRDGERSPKTDSFLERMLKGLGDFDANKLGFMKVFTTIFSSLGKIVAPVIGLITTLARKAMPLLVKAMDHILATIARVAIKIPALMKGLVTGVSSLISKIPFGAIAQGIGTVAKVAAPLLAVVGAGAAGYYAGTKLNEAMEGTAVGRAKDAMFDAVFSRIDKITGGAISGNPNGLDVPEEPKPKRVDVPEPFDFKKASQKVMLQKNPESASALQAIEETQKAARDKERTKTEKPAQVVVQDNSVKTQQTIMPARSAVTNMDPTFNRYMDTAFLATGRR